MVRTAVFADRAAAGRRLGELIQNLRPPVGVGPVEVGPVVGPVVVGMARGGVPVAHEVARILGAPLDVVVVRKLGHPRQPELGLGALGEDGVRVLNEPLIARLEVTSAVLAQVAGAESQELARRLGIYRGDRPPLTLEGRTVIVVDDGLATGFTARAAVEVVRRRLAARVVLAVPVGSPEATIPLRSVADEVVCLETTDRFFGISEWYGDFTQVTDDEVAALL
jgi:putative phosphoribosyl transferase